MPIDPAFTSWTPSGQTLGVNDEYRLINVHDGDTPRIEMSIRMLSVDTPEVTARSAAGAQRWDQRLGQLAEWIGAGRAPIGDDLAAWLQPRLATGRAGSLQFEQGQAASDFAKRNIAERLKKPGRGTRRLFVRTADEPFDDRGRLLAYIAPSYTREEREAIPPAERPTFNLDLVTSGWAAGFLIYPSIPNAEDLRLFVAAVETTVAEPRGAWVEPLALAGYEYRMAEKLCQATEQLEAGKRLTRAERTAWRSRLCADLETRELFGPEDYIPVPQHRRLWVWPKDVRSAQRAFDLLRQ